MERRQANRQQDPDLQQELHGQSRAGDRLVDQASLPVFGKKKSGQLSELQPQGLIPPLPQREHATQEDTTEDCGPQLPGASGDGGF